MDRRDRGEEGEEEERPHSHQGEEDLPLQENPIYDKSSNKRESQSPPHTPHTPYIPYIPYTPIPLIPPISHSLQITGVSSWSF